MPRVGDSGNAFGAAVSAVVVCLVLASGPVAAAERYAVIVSGVSGTAEHATKHAGWRDALVQTLTGPLGLPASNVVVLKDGPAGTPDLATRKGVEAAVTRFASRMSAADLLLIVLVGHGTFDGTDAKFNLVGPDLTADDWNALLAVVPGRIVFVNTAAASAPFLARLAGPKRVVITATDTPAQQYDTVFAEFFGPAFSSDEADLDKDGRVSIGEAFAFASAAVKRYYSERGQLSTERALLDDTGDGEGKQAGTPGADGAVASRIFLDPGPEMSASSDPALSELLARRDALEVAIEELKRKKEFMPPDDYEKELERLLVDHARLSRQIRSRS